MPVDCCFFVSLALSIAVIISGTIFTVRYRDERSYDYHLWWYCVVMVGIVLLGMLGRIGEAIYYCCITPKEWEVPPKEDKNAYLQYSVRRYIFDYMNAWSDFLLVCSFGLFIWGMYVYAKVKEHDIPYSHELWVFFLVTCWANAAIFILIFGLLALVLLVLCCAGVVAVGVCIKDCSCCV